MRKAHLLIAILPFLFLAACSNEVSIPPTAIPQQVTITPSPIPPTPTDIPKSLNICIGQEPASLYLYSENRSQAMWSVLEAIYDGPIDYVDYEYQAVILEKIPSLADGDAKLEPATVKEGMDIVDADGNYRTLQKGIKYLPSGCTSTDCVREYSGNEQVQMDQLSVQFKLKQGLTWADGVPLTAADSVFSYAISGSHSTIDLIRKTAAYTALDDQTVEWKGIPGFMDQKYMARFWIPQPSHMLSGKDLAGREEERQPLGWGPYMISEWVAGDHIQLIKNPFYFRAGEGLPKVDRITYRFLDGNSQQSMEALLSGECDLLDESTLLDDQLTVIKDLQAAGKLLPVISSSTIWEGINLGIKPSIYDTTLSAYNAQRPDYFEDKRTRQAISMCINKESINQEVWAGFAGIPSSFLGTGHPDLLNGLQDYSYNVDKANALFEEIGWKDFDNNPATPRVAVSVPNVNYGVPLSLSYYTTNSDARKKAAAMISEDLAQCGVQLNIKHISPEELFATGPEGVLFGRKFDLAQFSWSPSSMTACRFYTSAQINNVDNYWTGVNVSGYSSAEFDAACQAASAVLPGQESHLDKQHTVQQVFSEDLPVIPLYQFLRIGVSRVDLCGYQMDATSRSGLWNIENFDYGNGCK